MTTLKVTAAILGVVLLGTVGYIGNDRIVKEPYQRAVIELSDAYVQSDYVTCIDCMRDVKVQKMTAPQKFMLANAYVRSENLTQEQKDNILAKMTLNDTESKLDYWIYLGRSDTEQAADIALRLSDDQLLLYAYMKEKAITEENTELTGAEKSDKLNEITKKMEPLMENMKRKIQTIMKVQLQGILRGMENENGNRKNKIISSRLLYDRFKESRYRFPTV